MNRFVKIFEDWAARSISDDITLGQLKELLGKNFNRNIK